MALVVLAIGPIEQLSDSLINVAGAKYTVDEQLTLVAQLQASGPPYFKLMTVNELIDGSSQWIYTDAVIASSVSLIKNREVVLVILTGKTHVYGVSPVYMVTESESIASSGHIHNPLQPSIDRSNVIGASSTINAGDKYIEVLGIKYDTTPTVYATAIQGVDFVGGETLHADMADLNGIHGSGLRGIHGSGLRGIHGSGLRGIHGSGLRGIHGSGLRGIHGSGLRDDQAAATN
ncbi:MAG: hypothetical protein D6816_18095 [Bacteroidetes bacterium]|nr:MAG: hypothetical protein D6816_18095 [Bacteroidota bacterium]